MLGHGRERLRGLRSSVSESLEDAKSVDLESLGYDYSDVRDYLSRSNKVSLEYAGEDRELPGQEALEELDALTQDGALVDDTQFQIKPVRFGSPKYEATLQFKGPEAEGYEEIVVEAYFPF